MSAAAAARRGSRKHSESPRRTMTSSQPASPGTQHRCARSGCCSRSSARISGSSILTSAAGVPDIDERLSATAHQRRAAKAIGYPSPASTVPMSQRCTTIQAGREPRNDAIVPAAVAMSALTLRLIAISTARETSYAMRLTPICKSIASATGRPDSLLHQYQRLNPPP